LTGSVVDIGQEPGIVLVFSPGAIPGSKSSAFKVENFLAGLLE
jgi:hypothetical protein